MDEPLVYRRGSGFGVLLMTLAGTKGDMNRMNSGKNSVLPDFMFNV